MRQITKLPAVNLVSKICQVCLNGAWTLSIANCCFFLRVGVDRAPPVSRPGPRRHHAGHQRPLRPAPGPHGPLWGRPQSPAANAPTQATTAPPTPSRSADLWTAAPAPLGTSTAFHAFPRSRPYVSSGSALPFLIPDYSLIVLKSLGFQSLGLVSVFGLCFSNGRWSCCHV